VFSAVVACSILVWGVNGEPRGYVATDFLVGRFREG
jgi:hypothetical protein